MTLQELLLYIQDEEAYIMLEIDDDKEEYSYYSFWLSDYRENSTNALKYKNYLVTGILFENMLEEHSDITIQIKKI